MYVGVGVNVRMGEDTYDFILSVLERNSAEEK
jgi:hypothetical protein